MTEAQWLACADPTPMLAHLRHRPDRASDRQLWLFAGACCRRTWPFLTVRTSRDAVERVEQFADGALSLAELRGQVSLAEAVAESARRAVEARPDATTAATWSAARA